MILATRSGNLEYRNSITDDLLANRRANSITMAGVPITPQNVAGIPAVHAAATFGAESVAILPIGVWRGDGPVREKITTAWQAQLFQGNPNPIQDAFLFRETVEMSLEYRNSAYVWKTRGANGRVVMLWALHPDQVMATRHRRDNRILYTVFFADNVITPSECSDMGSVVVDSSTILHIRGRGSMGELIPKTPIELFRTSLGNIIAKQQHEANLYRNGVTKGLVVAFPQGTKADQAKQWRTLFDGDYAGVGNAGRTKVIGGGADVKEIGMTLKDAEFVESTNLSVMDVSRIFRVPSWFLGIDQAKEKALSPEHEQQRWLQHGLRPRLARIESAINADPDLFGNTDICARFDTSGIIRGDLQTQDTIAHQQIQDGRLLVDEWRVENGREELPGGIGKVPQITPVGGAPNPNA